VSKVEERMKTLIALVDPLRKTVVGVGTDRERAVRDAHFPTDSWLQFHEITLDQCKRICNGETAWPMAEMGEEPVS
jgi:hypothetical protein